MRRRLLISSLIALVAPFGPSFGGALAQDAPPNTSGAPAVSPEPPKEEPGTGPSEGEVPAPSEPALAPAPALPPIEMPATTPGPTALPTPGEAAAKLEQAAPPPPVEKKWWTAPETMFHLHGYFRLRANALKDGSLGHTAQFDRLPGGGRQNYDPFPYFNPADSGLTTSPGSNVNQPPVAGGCGKSPGADGGCGKHTEGFGDMRLRLKPEVHLSDDVRVKAWIDVLDNVGLGTMGYGPDNFKAQNVIRVRRVWGEARNRDIGELRFGRMARDWGLGILDNGGDRYGIDSDFSSDADRIMGITNLAGFYLMAAYDWAYEGIVLPGSATPNGVALNRSQKDDLNVVTLAAAHRLEADVQQSALQRGESVFNYGAYFVWRHQLLYLNPDFDPTSTATNTNLFNRLNQTQYIPDLWLQFLWEGLRAEMEALYVAGSIEGGCPKFIQNPSDPKGPNRDAQEVSATRAASSADAVRSSTGQCKFRQFGIALETEYRLFDDRLGIYFMSGIASGDPNSYGLAQTNDPSFQKVNNPSATGNRTISTYQFHPDYRVDLILWRTLMRRIAGGYYFKPGVSYDFIHDAYGQRAGASLDVIYSRASAPKQAWGQSGNLGLEMDLSLYYRTEDGPDPLDGFYGLLQWGVLFPFQGLDYAKSIVSAPGSKNAMIFRAVAGIAF